MESVKKTIDERAQHKRENNRRVNDKVMQSKEGKVDSRTASDAGLVVTESNEKGMFQAADPGKIHSLEDFYRYQLRRIFNTAGLKWVLTRKTFTSSTTKVDCESNMVQMIITNLINAIQTPMSVQAPLLKEKKSVRFSALYLQKKRNILVS
ncbi:hypothetical protein Tco_0673373 [Tanacetum coccineum]